MTLLQFWDKATTMLALGKENKYGATMATHQLREEHSKIVCN